MRVFELAKTLGLPSKALVTDLEALGIEVKSHMSSITEEDAQRVKDHYQAGTTPADAVAAARAEQAVSEPEPPPEPAPAEAAPVTEPQTESPAGEAAAEPAEEPEQEPAEEESKTIVVKGPVVVREFAEMLRMKPNLVIAELMSMNVFASISEKVEVRIAQQLAAKHGYTVEQEKKQVERKPPPKKKEAPVEPEVDEPDKLQPRPPIITFLGHVDHGKTSLLDSIREAKVAAGEHGGITQHIGAYTVEHAGQNITFLDTPGHAAFTAMRARGANLTDIAVIVIAADDGIMPQTREAIQHAKAAGIAIVVAVNKIDLPQADAERVKQQMQQEGLTSEDWGGDIVTCPVSAQTGEGMDHLLEMLLLQAEVLELRANPNRKAQGYVIESKLEPGRGPIANLLVRRGTLKVGEAILCGPFWGRIRALVNAQGSNIKSAGPSMPVMCLGLTDVPEAGSKFEVMPDAKKAKALSDERQAASRTESLGSPVRKVSLDDLLSATDPLERQELSVILKTDVQGSTEALVQSLEEIESDKIDLKIVMTGVGNVSTNDILLASASNAIVLGFHVAQDNGATSLAKREGIEVRLYQVIYELVDDVREAMTGMLVPEEREKVVGQAEIRQIFEMSNRRRVAGCMITKGRVASRTRARIRRGSDVVYEGRLATLKRFQNDANEVREGQECGMRLEGFSGYEVGDIIETYVIEQLAAKL